MVLCFSFGSFSKASMPIYICLPNIQVTIIVLLSYMRFFLQRLTFSILIY